MSDKGLICFSSVGGTAGDIRPLVALAVALRDRGYEIKVIGDGAFEASAARAGIRRSEWFTWSEVPQSFILRTTLGQRRLWGKHLRLRDRWMWRDIASHRRERLERFWREVGGPHNSKIRAAVGSASAYTMLRAFGSQCAKIVSSPFPCQPSEHYTLVPPDLSALQRMRVRILDRLAEDERQQFCEDFFHLVSVSPSIFPRPDDWLPNMHVTGYVQLEADQRGWSPSSRLQRFLEDGSAPVYIGFGSYPFLFGPRGERMAAEIVEGCRRRGVRCILHSPDLRTSVRSPDVLVEDGDVSYAWLFPRCAAIVHHGGYGTVHSTLAAGRPMIVYPFQTDQFLWAIRAGDVGIGPGFTARLTRLTAARLAADLEVVLRRECEARARRIAARLLTDRGLDVQVAAIESIIEHTARGGAPVAWRLPAAAAPTIH